MTNTKNDLSHIKLKPKNLLQQAHKSLSVDVKMTSAWRKTKPAAEKQSVVVGLRLTPSEFEAVKEKAGLVPVATYIRHELTTNANLFNQ